MYHPMNNVSSDGNHTYKHPCPCPCCPPSLPHHDFITTIVLVIVCPCCCGHSSPPPPPPHQHQHDLVTTIIVLVLIRLCCHPCLLLPSCPHPSLLSSLSSSFSSPKKSSHAARFWQNFESNPKLASCRFVPCVFIKYSNLSDNHILS